MSAHPAERTGPQPPLADLERALIAEYVRSRGFDPSRLAELPENQRAPLLKAAALYASGRLAEVESRSRLIAEISHREESA